ncbi:MAG: phosphonate C-P lyase system protein PhnH [Roseovarius sp.]|nr:phosphonate C-P lyase system protein PhnH [Roseovarius sp.]
MSELALQGGFNSPPEDAARAFRSIMGAMAHPGRIFGIKGVNPPAPMSVAMGTIALVLCDADTPLALMPSLDTVEVRSWITFQTGAPITAAGRAMFALGQWREMLPLGRFNRGEAEYPDRSATLIAECETLKNSGLALRGPGIRDVARLSLANLPAFQENAAQFPLGVDFLFCSGTQIAGVPRTTRISEV